MICFLFHISGFDLRWITVPGDTIRAQEEFDVTFELIIYDAFYTWVFDNTYFDAIVEAT